MHGSRLKRMLHGGASGACGCATAVITSVSFMCRPDPSVRKTVFITLPPTMTIPHTACLTLEAVEPRGPWRIFIADASRPSASATLFGPYTAAADTIAVTTDTARLLRDMGMRLRIEGDFDRVMDTFRACGAKVPSADDIIGS